MLVLVRKVDELLWSEKRDASSCASHEVPATLIQAKRELSAQECCLSFWLVDTDGDAWEEDAFLALLGASSVKRLDAMSVTWVEASALEAAGVEVRPTKGETKFRDLEDLHRDAVKLDGKRLALVAELLNASLLANNVMRKTRDQLLDILVVGVRDRKLAKAAQLPKDMKDQLATRGVV